MVVAVTNGPANTLAALADMRSTRGAGEETGPSHDDVRGVAGGPGRGALAVVTGRSSDEVGCGPALGGGAAAAAAIERTPCATRRSPRPR